MNASTIGVMHDWSPVNAASAAPHCPPELAPTLAVDVGGDVALVGSADILSPVRSSAR